LLATAAPTPSRLARLGRAALDLLLPPRCLACGVEVGAPGNLCAGCWPGLRFLTPPWCRACGYPLPHALPEAPLCPACAAEPPGFDRARAALRYDEGSRRLVLAFKRGARFEGVPSFGRWLARAGAELLPDADLVLPVPLHRWRLLSRGYNQSAVLAQAVAREAGRPWLPDALLRTRATASQQGLSATARRENITPAAFRVRPSALPRVEGARVVLVDDVLTTGSTLEACCAVLKRHGAARVDALTLARVVRDAGALI
jgi:ComF family protein